MDPFQNSVKQHWRSPLFGHEACHRIRVLAESWRSRRVQYTPRVRAYTMADSDSWWSRYEMARTFENSLSAQKSVSTLCGTRSNFFLSIYIENLIKHNLVAAPAVCALGDSLPKLIETAGKSCSRTVTRNYGDKRNYVCCDRNSRSIIAAT